jgi:hypothetical protein
MCTDYNRSIPLTTPNDPNRPCCQQGENYDHGHRNADEGQQHALRYAEFECERCYESKSFPQQLVSSSCQ